ncbi:MAG TPA: DUF4337 family protein [Rhizomicrobium sp.]|jgi:hypothetical protein|nr:DUF4337 family protein [Rhizomicrobium sp.]
MEHGGALDAHEHTEHAEHAAHARDPFISRVAISVAFLAVLAAVSGSLETVEGGRALQSTSEAVLQQDEATDTWSEFQADSLKKHMYTIAADAGGRSAADYRKNAKAYAETQKTLKQQAQAKERERETLLGAAAAHEDRHHWLAGAATLFEIGIAMCTVAIITRRRWLWYTSGGFAVVGLALLATTYLA